MTVEIYDFIITPPPSQFLRGIYLLVPYSQVTTFLFTSGTFVLGKDKTVYLAVVLQQTAFPYEVVYNQLSVSIKKNKMDPRPEPNLTCSGIPNINMIVGPLPCR